MEEDNWFRYKCYEVTILPPFIEVDPDCQSIRVESVGKLIVSDQGIFNHRPT